MYYYFMTLLAFIPLVLEAHQTASYIDGHPLLRSFHMGPWEPLPDEERCEEEVCDAQAPCEEEPCIKEARFFDPPPCQYCLECDYQHWCPYCGYCPIYDESDTVDIYDQHATWPSKHEDSWMREFAY